MALGWLRGIPGPPRGGRRWSRVSAGEHPSRVRPEPGASATRAAWGAGRGRGEEGVALGSPRLQSVSGGCAQQPAVASFRLRSRDPAARTGRAEPRSARRTGPSVPGGQGLRLRSRCGLTPHGACPSSRGNTREHPNLQQLSTVVKCIPLWSPLLSLPSSREPQRRATSQASSKSGTVATAVPDLVPSGYL